MGWTTTRREKGSSHKDWFQARWALLPEAVAAGAVSEILDMASVGNIVYGALRWSPGRTIGSPKVPVKPRVLALVIQTNWSPKDQFDNFGWRDGSELDGPVHCDCPARILALLDPLDDQIDPKGWAAEWRATCQARIDARRAKPKTSKGCHITFKNPIKFRSGTELAELVWIGGNKFNKPGDTWTTYKITNWRHRQFIVETHAV